MDCVAKPTHYEPPKLEPTPRERRAGWLSSVVPRRCVHYRALLHTPARVPLECSAQSRKARGGRWCHCLHARHRTYALRDEAPVHFQYATLPMW